MFHEEGVFDVKVIEAELTEARFGKNDPDCVDVALHVETTDGRYSGWWYGELSSRYGVGNNSDKMQWEITLGALVQNLAWEHNKAFTLAHLQSLVGRECQVRVAGREWDGKMYYDVKYLGAGGAHKRVQEDEAQARLARLFGGGGGATAAPASATAPQANPFA